MDSRLALATEEPVKKDSLKKYKILCVVLLALLVIVSLGLGLGLGLRKPEEQGSCRKKCFDSSHRGLEGCRCDSGCTGRGDCCWDFEDTCVKSTQIWTCNLFRCGENRLETALCSCADDCLQRKDCCADYKTVCQGESPWVTETCASSQEPQCPPGFDLPPVILFSMDGFRAEYLQTWSTLLPNINKLKTCGIHSKYMRAMYPTKTFPNHYTIVTGLYPESHGIIDNNMYDVHLNKNFSLSSVEKSNPAWWSGQPIWLTAMYQGLKAACYYWPGSDVAVNGSFPTIYRNYSNSVPYERRITTLLQWLDLPKADRPSFYTIYVEEPDSAGHSSGPVSAGVIKALQSVDNAFGMLMEGLKQRNLHNCVNIIVLADHGMDQTSCDRVEYMTDYFSETDFFMYQGPAPRIRTLNIPQDFFTFNSEEIVRNLSCRKPDQHFKPYLTPDLPKRLHYAKNVRIDKAHLMVDRQWLAFRTQRSSNCGGGTHGYNNEFKSMEVTYGSFYTETNLLHIQPAPNNGTRGSLNHLLKAPFYKPSHAGELSTPAGCGFTTPLPTDPLDCSCPELQNKSSLEEQANQRLNLSEGEVAATVKVNLPFGRPRVIQKNRDHCLLYHREYISGYGKAMKMPMWSSYTVLKPEATLSASQALRASPGSTPAVGALEWHHALHCSTGALCSFWGSQLKVSNRLPVPTAEPSSYPGVAIKRTNESQYDALITSNLVPMYREFKKMWDYFHEVLLIKYAVERNGLNVVSGPIFDYNYDGHFDAPDEITQYVAGTDVPIPTHYFVVLTSCKDQTYTPDNCPGWLDVLPFIIPHRPTNIESCPENKTEDLWVEERFQAHAARVRDVELLTGLDFYQEKAQPVSEILQLKTYLPTFETII
ncbi:ectonucleotide pyrophosphatase/phosphodiesterase family member 3 [Mus pahari]|uniref:ectonucleotide pyrophosphatase/phosphodiesterase family member 3 n=1 Tax=Mus pahari TaxID=10093 RepID=UPI000A305886|nr:ectonucleotide pyrophosphatase/phosphodiesterase family member 3 [Mus pahari]